MASLYYFFVTLCVLKTIACTINNVCPTIEDYYTITENVKCWYDFTADSNVTDIISKHGYPVEIHKGVTPDGYILTIIRIPYNKALKAPNKGPVFIQHGLHGSSSNFVAMGKDSLAFVLADSGYDVWLGNYRGSEYSQDHVNLTTNDRKYWDYSMDEIGLYDIPTQLSVIANKTGNKGNIVYIGYSLGTTVGLIYGSWYPKQAAKHVKLFIMLAPFSTAANMLSPLKVTAMFMNTVYDFILSNDLIKLVSKASVLRNFVRTICLDTPLLMKRCVDIINFLVFGKNSQMGAEVIPSLLNQFPGGTSFKVVHHGANLIFNFFGRYDYGAEKNLAIYGTVTPPRYQVSKIEVPVFVVYSAGDWSCTKEDSQVLFKRLSQKAKVYGMLEVAEVDFNHLDFVVGKHAKSLIYNHIVNLLNKLGVKD